VSSALLAVVLAVVGGLADRLERRRVLASLALVSALVIAGLAALSLAACGAALLAMAATGAVRLPATRRVGQPPARVGALIARSWRDGARAVRRHPLAMHLAVVVAVAGVFA